MSDDTQFINVGLPELERAKALDFYGKVTMSDPKVSQKTGNTYAEVRLSVQTPPFKDRKIKYMGRVVWKIFNLTPEVLANVEPYLGERGIVTCFALDEEEYTPDGGETRITTVAKSGMAFDRFYNHAEIARALVPVTPFRGEPAEDDPATQPLEEAETGLD